MSTHGVENRGSPRRKMFKGAKAVFNDGNSLYDCQLRDWSESGAKLVFHELTPVPKSFVLRLNDGTEVACEIVRVVGTVVGVRFTGR